LRALASQYGGDPAATDISRLLRLPGFANRKYNEAFVVRVHHESDAIHHLQDFHISEDSPESSESLHGIAQRNSPYAAGHRVVSRKQTGRTRNAALARGDDTENHHSTHRRLSRRRQSRSALLRATHTVEKAQLALMSPERSTIRASRDSGSAGPNEIIRKEPAYARQRNPPTKYPGHSKEGLVDIAEAARILAVSVSHPLTAGYGREESRCEDGTGRPASSSPYLRNSSGKIESNQDTPAKS